jgi:ribonuclease P protein subunit POP4
VWQVPKAGTTFEFTLEGDDTQVVTVEGERLESRPARRTERTGDSKWR